MCLRHRSFSRVKMSIRIIFLQPLNTRVKSWRIHDPYPLTMTYFELFPICSLFYLYPQRPSFSFHFLPIQSPSQSYGFYCSATFWTIFSFMKLLLSSSLALDTNKLLHCEFLLQILHKSNTCKSFQINSQKR